VNQCLATWRESRFSRRRSRRLEYPRNRNNYRNNGNCREIDPAMTVFFSSPTRRLFAKAATWPANLSDINDGERWRVKRTPFIIAPITAGSIDCPSITLATRPRCGRPGFLPLGLPMSPAPAASASGGRVNFRTDGRPKRRLSRSADASTASAFSTTRAKIHAVARRLIWAFRGSFEAEEESMMRGNSLLTPEYLSRGKH